MPCLRTVSGGRADGGPRFWSLDVLHLGSGLHRTADLHLVQGPSLRIFKARVSYPCRLFLGGDLGSNSKYPLCLYNTHYVRSASKRQRGQLFVLFLDFFFFPLTFLTAIICASFLKTNKLHRTSEDKVCHKRCNHFITSQDVSVSSLVVGRMVLLPPYYRLRNASESNVLLLTKKRRLIVCPCVYF